MSPFLTDLIQQVLSGHLMLDVVTKLDTRDFLEQRLRLSTPDLVLIGLFFSETDAVAVSILALLPGAQVIAFSGDGHHAYVHQMLPHRTALLDVSPQALLDAIRHPSHPTSKL